MDPVKLKPQAGLGAAVARAVEGVAAAGGSPRAQIDAARSATDKTLVYMPHQGARERARRRRRLAAIGAA